MPEPKSVEPRAGWPKCGIGLAFDGCRLRMVALKDHMESITKRERKRNGTQPPFCLMWLMPNRSSGRWNHPYRSGCDAQGEPSCLAPARPRHGFRAAGTCLFKPLPAPRNRLRSAGPVRRARPTAEATSLCAIGGGCGCRGQGAYLRRSDRPWRRRARCPCRRHDRSRCAPGAQDAQSPRPGRRYRS